MCSYARLLQQNKPIPMTIYEFITESDKFSSAVDGPAKCGPGKAYSIQHPTHTQTNTHMHSIGSVEGKVYLKNKRRGNDAPIHLRTSISTLK